MSRLEVLCVAMEQNDCSLARKMNIKCDLLIANQASRFETFEAEYNSHRVRMITTQTRGVGKNRNISLLHATGEILLLSDDDVSFQPSYVNDIISEFDDHPDADVIIFNLQSNDEVRKQKINKSTRKLGKIAKMPYGAPRVAFRRSSWEKSNVWFTTLFGGGTPYTSGEDSIFLKQLRRTGLVFYVSSKTIGTVDMSSSSWFQGANEQFYFNKGAFYAMIYPHSTLIWKLYIASRVKSNLSFKDRMKYCQRGIEAFRNGKTFQDYCCQEKN